MHSQTLQCLQNLGGITQAPSDSQSKSQPSGATHSDNFKWGARHENLDLNCRRCSGCSAALHGGHMSCALVDNMVLQLQHNAVQDSFLQERHTCPI